MKLSNKDLDGKYIYTLTTRKVKEILRKQDSGEKISNHEKIWFDNQIGVRKGDIKFAMTKKEIDEYTKCKMDIFYFANNYCHIKREDGTTGQMTLRDYQRDMLDLYHSNNYSILMASRQMGKCNSMITNVLIQDTNNNVRKITMGELYYEAIKEERNLTFKEKVKYSIYKILSKI